MRCVLCVAVLSLGALSSAWAQPTPAPVITLSGLNYQSFKEGTGARASAGSSVVVHYRGFLLDGKEFDSSYQRGAPAEFELRNVIRCWTEGVSMMREGGKARLVCPPSLAYGAAGAGGVIPPNATLTFDVELLQVKRR